MMAFFLFLPNCRSCSSQTNSSSNLWMENDEIVFRFCQVCTQFEPIFWTAQLHSFAGPFWSSFFSSIAPWVTPTHYIIRILFSSRLYKLDNGVLGNANLGKSSPAALLSCAVHQRAQVFTWAVHCLIAKKKEFELYILQPQLLFATRYLFENKLVISSLPPIRASGSFKPMGGSTSLAGPRLQTTLTRHCNGWVREYPQWFPTQLDPHEFIQNLNAKSQVFTLVNDDGATSAYKWVCIASQAKLRVGLMFWLFFSSSCFFFSGLCSSSSFLLPFLRPFFLAQGPTMPSVYAVNRKRSAPAWPNPNPTEYTPKSLTTGLSQVNTTLFTFH